MKTIKHWFSGEDIYCQEIHQAAVVKYLNTHKIDFLWQPQTFTMPDGRMYTPDIYLEKEDLWIIIEDSLGSTDKWLWFRCQYTNSRLWDQEILEGMGII